MKNINPLNCPDCGVEPGVGHRPGCDVAHCPACGEQRLTCFCASRRKSIWSGSWPGQEEAIAFGWFAKLIPGKGWVPCAESDPEASPDLNRLIDECEWDQIAEKWVIPKKKQRQMN